MLVIGATGAVGRGAVAELLARRVPFTAASREPGRARQLLGKEVAVVALDLEDEASLARALEGHAKLLLVPPSLEGPRQRRAVGAATAAAKRAGVERVALVSGYSARHDERSPSRGLECEVEQAGLPATFLRPNFFSQNYHTHYRAGLRRGRIELYTGAGRTSLIDARDVGAAAVAALLDPAQAGRAHLLTGPEALGDADVARILTRVLGRPIVYTARSPEGSRTALREAGLPESLIEASLERLAQVAAGIFAEVSPALEALLGRPPLRFERCVRDHVHLF